MPAWFQSDIDIQSADATPKELDQRKKELDDLIVEVLRRHPMLGYFQASEEASVSVNNLAQVLKGIPGIP